MGKPEAFTIASSANAGPKSSAGYGDSARCFTIAALLSLLVLKQAGENWWKYKLLNELCAKIHVRGYPVSNPSHVTWDLARTA